MQKTISVQWLFFDLQDVFLLLCVFIYKQGRNGEIRYSIRASDAIPVEALTFFYVNPLSGDLSVIRGLTEDQDQPESYRVTTLTVTQWFPCPVLLSITSWQGFITSENQSGFIPPTVEIGGRGIRILESADGRLGGWWNVVSQTSPKVFKSYKWNLLQLLRNEDVHDIMCVSPGQRVLQLCPIFQILIYPYYILTKQG
mgnify:FL=1